MSDSGSSPVPLRRPPSNLRAEQSILGAMLMSREAIAEVVEILEPDYFYKPAHGHLYDAIMGLYGAGKPADVVTVAEELDRANLLEEIGGPGMLLELQNSTPAISNAAHYAKIVEEHALLRRLIAVSNEIAEMAYEVPDDVIKAIDEAEAKMFEVAQRRVTNTTAQIKDLLSANLDRLELLYERGEEITGTRSGYTDLDKLLAGLQPQALYVIGARPAMGKALALDTLIPTPEGWSTMGELQVGDHVFDEQGRSTEVIYKSPVYTDHQCYRVRFDDGTELIADAEHQWWTCDASGAEGVRTTAELAATVRVGREALPNHHVALCGPLELPDAELAIDPYLLGCWLADSSRGQFPPDFAEMLAELGLGAAQSQHIPQQYLRASAKQRLGLLQGFMDSSGDVAPDRPEVQVCLNSAELLTQVRELVLSLGYKAPAIGQRAPAEIETGLKLGAWTLTFNALDPVFRSEHKAQLQHDRCAQREARRRVIESVESHPSVAVQCITVDSPNHLYLAGSEMVPTHNTAFALGMAANAAMAENKPVLFFSLEMGQLELSQRILCSQALVDSSRVKTGRIEESEWNRISHAVGMLADAPIYIDDNPQTSVMEIRAKSRRLKSRVGELGLVVVDYIQLMSGRSNAESRQVEVSEISRGLKILAREIDTPVVALAQLNRGLEQRVDKRPMLSDLRESGSLEQDADVVMFLYRDEVYDPDSPDRGVAEVLVAKHRNGPTGRVKLAFRGQYTRFDDMAPASYGGGPPPGADDRPPAPRPEEF